jgi:hypothetical protein
MAGGKLACSLGQRARGAGHRAMPAAVHVAREQQQPPLAQGKACRGGGPTCRTTCCTRAPPPAPAGLHIAQARQAGLQHLGRLRRGSGGAGGRQPEQRALDQRHTGTNRTRATALLAQKHGKHRKSRVALQAPQPGRFSAPCTPAALPCTSRCASSAQADAPAAPRQPFRQALRRRHFRQAPAPPIPRPPPSRTLQ